MWPPTPPKFNEFITSVIERDDSLPLISMIQYDEKVIDDIQNDGSRYAAHCLLWSKTNQVFENRRGDIPMKALFMV